VAAKTIKNFDALFVKKGGMMKRREFFLRFGSGLLVGTALFPSYLIAAVTNKGGNRLVDFSSGLSKTKFEALLNEFFYVYTERDGIVPVQLLQIKGLKGPSNTEQFSLFFKGPYSPSLTAGSYEIEHDLTGNLSLYLEPFEAPENVPLYRADFSLLR
jgi:hypothetical protein